MGVNTSTAMSPKASTKTEPTDDPPPYEASAVSDTPQHGVSTQSQSKSPAHSSTACAKSRKTVSRLPLDNPAVGWSYIVGFGGSIPAPDPAARSSSTSFWFPTSRVYNEIQPGEIERPINTSYFTTSYD